MPTCNCQASLFQRLTQLVAHAGLLVSIATIIGCVSPEQRAERIARRHGLEPVVLRGIRFQHHAYMALRGPSDLLVLFIDGDGSPWVRGGREIAVDPTPHVPLALELAAATPISVLYLARPCYLETVIPPECSPRLWTSERYSAAVVASMAAAAAAFVAEHHFARVLLVGYSGGGTLAALMAQQLPEVSGLVSIAGNLDPDTWTQLHGYLPLEGSLNPALEPALPEQLKQWYLVGALDMTVPAAATGRYFRRISPDRVWSFARFDHLCCWADEWPSLFRKIMAELNAGETPDLQR